MSAYVSMRKVGVFKNVKPGGTAGFSSCPSNILGQDFFILNLPNQERRVQKNETMAREKHILNHKISNL